MLAHIRRRAREAGLADRVRALRGDAEALPLAAAACDAVFLSQVLHHAARPPAAVAEAARVLRPGGRLIVLDLQRHEQAWVRDQLADQWLGFEPDELKRWIEAAGLGVLSLTAVTENRRDLSVLVAAARKRGAPVGRDLVSRRGRRKER
jgi:ArsR family transcriptional regulator